MIPDDVLDRFRVPHGKKVKLKDYDTGWAQTEHLKELGKAEAKARAAADLKQSRAALAEAQELLYADDRYAVLVVLQAMDAAGKDGTIKHVMSGVNPQGCQVFSFKQPSAEELQHDFLWRHVRCLPDRGRIGIFNRSYYEDVLVVKVHPELLESQKLPPGKRGKAFWEHRYEDINAFERHLARNGTVLVKVFLHLSKREQKKRFLKRLDQPDKHWKFSPGDLAERARWDDYVAAYEDALTETSTKHAAWHVVPADDKWAARAVVGHLLASTIRSLDLHYPRPTAEALKAIEAAKAQLEGD